MRKWVSVCVRVYIRYICSQSRCEKFLAFDEKPSRNSNMYRCHILQMIPCYWFCFAIKIIHYIKHILNQQPTWVLSQNPSCTSSRCGEKEQRCEFDRICVTCTFHLFLYMFFFSSLLVSKFMFTLRLKKLPSANQLSQVLAHSFLQMQHSAKYTATRIHFLSLNCRSSRFLLKSLLKTVYKLFYLHFKCDVCVCVCVCSFLSDDLFT